MRNTDELSIERGEGVDGGERGLGCKKVEVEQAGRSEGRKLHRGAGIVNTTRETNLGMFADGWREKEKAKTFCPSWKNSQ